MYHWSLVVSVGTQLEGGRMQESAFKVIEEKGLMQIVKDGSIFGNGCVLLIYVLWYCPIGGWLPFLDCKELQTCSPFVVIPLCAGLTKYW